MMHWGWHGFGGGGMLVMGLLMVLFWGGLIALAVAAVWAATRARRGGGGEHRAPGRALEILQERYARGEVSREEFEQMRRDLSA